MAFLVLTFNLIIIVIKRTFESMVGIIKDFIIKFRLIGINSIINPFVCWYSGQRFNNLRIVVIKLVVIFIIIVISIIIRIIIIIIVITFVIIIKFIVTIIISIVIIIVIITIFPFVFVILIILSIIIIHTPIKLSFILLHTISIIQVSLIIVIVIITRTNFVFEIDILILNLLHFMEILKSRSILILTVPNLNTILRTLINHSFSLIRIIAS